MIVETINKNMKPKEFSMKSKTMMVAMAAAFLMAAPAWAGDHEGGDHKGHKGHQRHLEKMDTDKDGAVSKDEFMKAQEERFAGVDKNGDGSLSEAEFKAKHDEMKAKMQERRKAWQEKRQAEEDAPAPDVAPAE